MIPKIPKNIIIFLNEIDSTNRFLKKLVKEKQVDDGTVILADNQTSGRGQGSNLWHSKRGLNILMSMLFKPLINASEHFSLSEFVSLAITDTLHFYKIEAQIKWPNDIYVHNEKIAGILIENSIENDIVKYMIAGIGLNVNEEIFPNELPNPVSMKTILKHRLNRKIFLDKLILFMNKRYQQLAAGDYKPLHAEYNNNLYRRNIPCDFKAGDQLFKATIKEVGQTGELILITQQQVKKAFLFGEVRMVI